jgi:hypothetical protein
VSEIKTAEASVDLQTAINRFGGDQAAGKLNKSVDYKSTNLSPYIIEQQRERSQLNLSNLRNTVQRSYQNLPSPNPHNHMYIRDELTPMQTYPDVPVRTQTPVSQNSANQQQSQDVNPRRSFTNLKLTDSAQRNETRPNLDEQSTINLRPVPYTLTTNNGLPKLNDTLDRKAP